MSRNLKQFGELTLFILVFLACGSDGSSEDYQDQYGVVSDHGVFVLDLIPKVSLNLVGRNRYEINLADRQGKPLDQAQITIIPWMPDHGHGTDREPSISPMGNGVYEVDDVVYTMPGLWHLNVEISTASMFDNARFELEVY